MRIISQEKHFHGWSMFASRNYLYVPIILYPIDDADEAGGKVYIPVIIEKINSV